MSDYIGAMWKSKTKKGTDYFSGNITVKGERVQFVAFFNDYKKDSKHPDYKIKLSVPREQEEKPASTSGGFEDDIPWLDENKTPQQAEQDLF